MSASVQTLEHAKSYSQAPSTRPTDRMIQSVDQALFHRNLLALNAAVEAARPGPAAKAFAAVAERIWKDLRQASL